MKLKHEALSTPFGMLYKFHFGVRLFEVLIPNKAFTPMHQATLGAMISRTSKNMEERIRDLSEAKKDRIVTAWVKYKHGSIGDMGRIIVNITGIGMLDAYEMIDHPLFGGQQVSTRYVACGDAEFILPKGLSNNAKDRAEKICQKQMELYEFLYDNLMVHFVEAKGIPEAQAKPKVFDIVGGFLPIATKTGVYIDMSIRSFLDQAYKLKASDYSEVVDIGGEMIEIIRHLCYDGISVPENDIEAYKGLSDYLASHGNGDDFTLREIPYANVDFSKFNSCMLNEEMLKLLSECAPDLLPDLSRMGVISAVMELSCRSGRDVRRSRTLVRGSQLPDSDFDVLLGALDQGARFGWYIEQLPKELQNEALGVIKSVSEEIEKLRDVEASKDVIYLSPMLIPARIKFDGYLHHWIYFLNLRSGQGVHPELQSLVSEQMFSQFADAIGLDMRSLFGRTGGTNYEKRAKAEVMVPLG